jgi:hypothetical protein
MFTWLQEQMKIFILSSIREAGGQHNKYMKEQKDCIKK